MLYISMCRINEDINQTCYGLSLSADGSLDWDRRSVVMA